MARAGFYNENEYRDYPFLTQVEPLDIAATIERSSSSSSLSSISSVSSAGPVPLLGLPHETIVDFGAIMAVDSRFKTADDFVWLRRIRRKDPYLLFEFRTTALNGQREKLVFYRHINDDEFKYSWAESIDVNEPDNFPGASSSSFSSSSSSCPAYTCDVLNVTNVGGAATEGLYVRVARRTWRHVTEDKIIWFTKFSTWAVGDPDNPISPDEESHAVASECVDPQDATWDNIEVTCGSLSSSSGSSASSNPFCDPETDTDVVLPCGGPGCDTPFWEGFLITGLFGELLDQLADGEQLIFVRGVWVIENARIQNLNNSYARSVNLGNFDRARVTPPENCGSASAEVTEAYPNATCMQGHLQFREGFNCNIRQEDANNTLVITGAAGGGGYGYPCEEIPLYDGESAPMDSPFLSGGPACGEIVRTVSGKGGPAVRIYGGTGIRVYDAPANPSALFVDADLGDFALCLQTEPGPGDPCYVGSSSSSSSAGGP
jgi:hypothetical protein